jgi:uncharacterized protein
MATPAGATFPNKPSAFHVMAKPTGARCNLDCEYCFFLKKEALYPGSSFQMSDAVMEAHIRQTLAAHAEAPEVTIAWQGGEPTLMGLDFFRRAMEVEERHQRPGVRIQNTMQTNGVLLNNAWGDFLKAHDFLVGISVDGPREMHDRYRRDKAGNPTFDKVMRGLQFLQKHEVAFNILCTVNSANAAHPLEVYRFFRDEIGAQFMQFIPVVELYHASGELSGSATVTARSVGSLQWGHFLNSIFDEWIRRDVGQTFVQVFDGVLASWVRGQSSLCIFQPTCGDGVALEHNGDLYSCDHFVDEKHFLGNILEHSLGDLVASQKQRSFGHAKQETLPQYCRDCTFLFACHGECPKNRFLETPAGEAGLNYLCGGLKLFFAHVDRPMRIMAEILRRGLPASEVMRTFPMDEKRLRVAAGEAGRNAPCPCGSGEKSKRCHASARASQAATAHSQLSPGESRSVDG